MIAHIHPETGEEQSVLSHLRGCAEIARQLGTSMEIPALSCLTALVHDMGKWRGAFETYIHASHAGDIRARRGSVNHSSAGAIYLVRRYDHGERDRRLTAQLAANAILSHHGLTDCLSPDGTDRFHKRVDSLKDLDYDEVVGHLLKSDILDTELDAMFSAATEEVRHILDRAGRGGVTRSFAVAMLQRLLLSVLIDADRLDTAVFCGDRDKRDLLRDVDFQWKPLSDRLERYLLTFQGKDTVSQVRRAVSDACRDFASGPTGIYRLTAPTGGAKTLAMLRFALLHALNLKKRRIFYIGPLLSIIEQNAEVYRKVLGKEFLLEHHSNVIPDEENGEDSVCSHWRHLTESWDSPLVVTTFVQLLNTLFSGSTQSVRRFHNLADSVVLIDEIQTLPIHMVSIFNLAVNFLSAAMGATVILCSATQPVLDMDRVPCKIRMGTPAEIIPCPEELFQKMRRVRVVVQPGSLTTEALYDLAERLINEADSLLIVLNTKTAVRQVFTALQERMQGEDLFLVHLSNHMCPEHRLHRIEEIKARLKKQKVLCVSTTLIEAGVDLSFANEIRSFAGLPSIAQAAGRCNRNGERNEGTLYLVHYREERLGRLEQVERGAKCCEKAAAGYQSCPEAYGGDLLSPEAIRRYYDDYFYDDSQVAQMCYPLRSMGTSLLDLLTANRCGLRAWFELNGARPPDLTMLQAYASAGGAFEAIEKHTTGVIVPYGEGAKLIADLCATPSSGALPGLLRRAQRFTVDLYPGQFHQLSAAGALYQTENGGVLFLKDGFYDEQLGVVLEGKQSLLEA